MRVCIIMGFIFSYITIDLVITMEIIKYFATFIYDSMITVKYLRFNYSSVLYVKILLLIKSSILLLFVLVLGKRFRIDD